MADKLSLYNGALTYLEERKLASLNENREPRRALDDAFVQEVAYCLERKFWNFGYRTVSIDASTTMVPDFGPQYAFNIPDDWIRTRKLSVSPTLDPPLLDVLEEAGFWYADATPLFVQYNSNDSLYGMNLGLWPASFNDYVELRLATKTCKRITGSTELLQGAQGLLVQEKNAYKIAAANCAMNEAVGFAPMSKWIRSRRHTAFGDAPSGGTLIP